MPNVGGAEILLIAVYVIVVVAIIALPIFVLREMRRRGDQLDRIERRLNDLDGRGGPPDPRRSANPGFSGRIEPMTDTTTDPNATAMPASSEAPAAFDTSAGGA